MGFLKLGSVRFFEFAIALKCFYCWIFLDSPNITLIISTEKLPISLIKSAVDRNRLYYLEYGVQEFLI